MPDPRFDNAQPTRDCTKPGTPRPATETTTAVVTNARAAVRAILTRRAEFNTLTGASRVLISADEWEALRAWVFDLPHVTPCASCHAPDACTASGWCSHGFPLPVTPEAHDDAR